MRFVVFHKQLKSIKRGGNTVAKKQNNITAVILEKVASISVKMATDSRCMYILHQPKQPPEIKSFH